MARKSYNAERSGDARSGPGERRMKCWTTCRAEPSASKTSRWAWCVTCAKSSPMRTSRSSPRCRPTAIRCIWMTIMPRTRSFEGRIAHGMLTAGLISAVIGEQLPGHGTIYMSQSLKFLAPVRPGRSGAGGGRGDRHRDRQAPGQAGLPLHRRWQEGAGGRSHGDGAVAQVRLRQSPDRGRCPLAPLALTPRVFRTRKKRRRSVRGARSVVSRRGPLPLSVFSCRVCCFGLSVRVSALKPN